MKFFSAALLAFSLVLCGCLVGPNYKRPTIPAPAVFRGQPTAEQNSFADQGWWSVYSDPFLNGSGVVECLLRSILECAHQRGAKEQLRPENGDRQSQRGRGVSWRGPVCLLSPSEPGVRGPTRSCCLQI